MQAISDKTFADWERVRKYSNDDLPEIKVNFLLSIDFYELNWLFIIKSTSFKINEIGKNYFELVSSFNELRDNGKQLPDVNGEFCMDYLKN